MNAALLLCTLLASSAGATGFGEPRDGLAARLEFLEPERLAAGNLRLRLTLRNVGEKSLRLNAWRDSRFTFMATGTTRGPFRCARYEISEPSAPVDLQPGAEQSFTLRCLIFTSWHLVTATLPVDRFRASLEYSNEDQPSWLKTQDRRQFHTGAKTPEASFEVTTPRDLPVPTPATVLSRLRLEEAEVTVMPGFVRRVDLGTARRRGYTRPPPGGLAPQPTGFMDQISVKVRFDNSAGGQAEISSYRMYVGPVQGPWEPIEMQAFPVDQGNADPWLGKVPARSVLEVYFTQLQQRRLTIPGLDVGRPVVVAVALEHGGATSFIRSEPMQVNAPPASPTPVAMEAPRCGNGKIDFASGGMTCAPCMPPGPCPCATITVAEEECDGTPKSCEELAFADGRSRCKRCKPGSWRLPED
ncbi:MAG: hypothetical protein M3Y59_22850 [Myxococcota bacterium]|nr:hypothetical protein [Myxococcota bacterium]